MRLKPAFAIGGKYEEGNRNHASTCVAIAALEKTLAFIDATIGGAHEK